MRALERKGKLGRREVLKALGAAPLAAFVPRLGGQESQRPFYFACADDNDLFEVAKAAGLLCKRFGDAESAVARAPEGSGVLILADGYPRQKTVINAAVYEKASKKGLRLYVEFPDSVPGLGVGDPQRVARGREHNILERCVVATDSFAPALKRMQILELHDCIYVPVKSQSAELVLARVAGFDTALYGLPQNGIHPTLFRHPDRDILIATTKLSEFIKGRYAPSHLWPGVWRWVFEWLSPKQRPVLLRWTPLVHPAFEKDQRLPKGAELNAFRRGVQWFSDARLFVAPSWKRVIYESEAARNSVRAPLPSWTLGDGSDGVFEGFSSEIEWNGMQPVGWNLRADCTGEVSMAMAFSGAIDKKSQNRKIAANLNNFIYFNSELSSGARSDPRSPSFGLLGWCLPHFEGVYYGDDNARSVLGTMAAAGLLQSDRWDEKVLRCLLANLRTTGVLGFRHDKLTEKQLQEFGWRHFYDEKLVNYHPHYQAYPWACFLRAYGMTHYSPFLDRARTGIRMTMAAYPNNWSWTNGFQQERARMLLPLAWLIRVEDKAEHRQWLKQIVTDLLAFQSSSGGIREELGGPGKKGLLPPKSNAEYGTSEAPLIQENGDPVCDLLYTMNFAFLGLHEAAAATHDPICVRAENKLAEFLCRIQIQSEKHPELAGGWFRAFDFDAWDYWASNSDSGWGAWSIETGWTQSWITAVLGMRQLRTSLWDLTGRSNLGAGLNQLLPVMFGS
ncbi:MAG TPA: hypothetical protein VFL79_20395 [Terriglobia bacterium]|nr:hypothetical protein [Terriglobia bacterium]